MYGLLEFAAGQAVQGSVIVQGNAGCRRKAARANGARGKYCLESVCHAIGFFMDCKYNTIPRNCKIRQTLSLE